MFTIHTITIQAVHQQDSWVVHRREESLCSDIPANTSGLRLGEKVRTERQLIYARGPLSNFRLWGKAGAIRCQSSELSISQPVVSDQSKSMSSGAHECSDPHPRFGWRHVWSRGPSPAGGRGGEGGSVPFPEAQGSIPTARGRVARRKMAARSAADSHVSRQHRQHAPSRSDESPTRREVQTRAASMPQKVPRVCRPGRQGITA